MASDNGKKSAADKKTSQAKSDKDSARSRTIELTAEDVTPPKKKPSEEADAAKEQASQPGDQEKVQKSEKDKPVKKRGSAVAYLFSAFLGAALALAGGYALLVFKIVTLPDNSKSELLVAISGLEKQLKLNTEQSEGKLNALAGDLEKTRNHGQVQGEMLAITNAGLAALKMGLAKTDKAAADLVTKTQADAAVLAKTGAVSQNALNSARDNAKKLASESRLRAELGPQIAANTAQTQKRALDIAGLSKGIERSGTTAAKMQSRIDGLFNGLKDIEKAVAEAGVSAGGAPSSAGVRISLLGRKLKRLEQNMAGFSNTLKSLPAVPPDVSPQISILEKALMRVSKGITDLGGRDARRQDALRRLQDKAEATAGKTAKIDRLDERISALTATSGRLQDEISRLNKAAQTLKINADGSSGALGTLSGRLGELSKELAGRIEGLEKSTAEIVNAEKKLSVIDARLADVKSAQARIDKQQNIAARVQGANRLQRDMLSGESFKAALFAFVEIAPEIKIPGNLSASAEGGVATMAQLRSRFANLREGIEAQNILDGGEGLMGQLMKTAGSVVSVRRTGPTAGAGAGAISSRITALLEKDNLASAVTEATGFEGAAAEKAASWIMAAKARLDAERFSNNLAARIYSSAKGE